MKDFFSKPDDILTAAEKYIAENGTEDLQNIINRVYILTNFTVYGWFSQRKQSKNRICLL